MGAGTLSGCSIGAVAASAPGRGEPRCWVKPAGAAVWILRVRRSGRPWTLGLRRGGGARPCRRTRRRGQHAFHEDAGRGVPTGRVVSGGEERARPGADGREATGRAPGGSTSAPSRGMCRFRSTLPALWCSGPPPTLAASGSIPRRTSRSSAGRRAARRTRRPQPDRFWPGRQALLRQRPLRRSRGGVADLAARGRRRRFPLFEVAFPEQPSRRLVCSGRAGSGPGALEPDSGSHPAGDGAGCSRPGGPEHRQHRRCGDHARGREADAREFDGAAASLLAVLELLRVFTAPTFTTFTALVTGLVAQTGPAHGDRDADRRGADPRLAARPRPRLLLPRRAGTPDLLGIVAGPPDRRRLLPEGAALTVAVDDTLFKRRGKKVFGAAWQHDGAATGPEAGRARELLRRRRPRGPTAVPGPAGVPAGDGPAVAAEAGASKVDLAASMVAPPGRLPPRPAHPRGRGRRLPRQGPARPARDMHLDHPAAAHRRAVTTSPRRRTGKRGRPALKGDRLGTPGRTRRHRHLHAGAGPRATAAPTPCGWPRSPACGTAPSTPTPCRVILLRDEDTDTGYDLALVTTDLTTPAGAGHPIRLALVRSSSTFAEARDLLGVGQARNRTRARGRAHRPVRPVLLHDHRPLVRTARPPPQRRRRPPRHAPPGTPPRPTRRFADMLAKLRRVIIAARFLPIRPGQPTDQEIRAVQQAWAAAASAHLA